MIRAQCFLETELELMEGSNRRSTYSCPKTSYALNHVKSALPVFEVNKVLCNCILMSEVQTRHERVTHAVVLKKTTENSPRLTCFLVKLVNLWEFVTNPCPFVNL